MHPLRNSWLLPWQSTILWIEFVCLAILFVSLLIVLLLEPKKKAQKKKWSPIFCWIGLIFFAVLTLCVASVISFFVASTQGWKLSFVAGVSVIIGAISLIAGTIGALTKAPNKYVILWGFLGMASFLVCLLLTLNV